MDYDPIEQNGQNSDEITEKLGIDISKFFEWFHHNSLKPIRFSDENNNFMTQLV